MHLSYSPVGAQSYRPMSASVRHDTALQIVSVKTSAAATASHGQLMMAITLCLLRREEQLPSKIRWSTDICCCLHGRRVDSHELLQLNTGQSS
ncbi:hypothetical protein MPTK1_5g22500 [Marchantia polymorpha subsp. ruderalis]|uniref:Uncharacterized protein n=2 Tax=Marchantia polymorpha TaxID=3197 RepID=A0AAF6BL50_MARPO|nr:hypothetical protein MARPO_0010s0207 [Marchantia polymorpha]BBN12734.1 hypothetical protein Mp_5g22500 [Marchantia polymorpha subsp. ruderalis]|eukprot:PTQ46847.1 hypothetical protein MARPO_0010s0207 [Marchantia polymorpha]